MNGKSLQNGFSFSRVHSAIGLCLLVARLLSDYVYVDGIFPRSKSEAIARAAQADNFINEYTK